MSGHILERTTYKLHNSRFVCIGFISIIILADLVICKPFETLSHTNRESIDLERLVDDWMTEGGGLEQRYRREVAADLTDIDIRVSVMKRSTRRWEPWQLNRDICPPSLCSPADEFGPRIRPRGTVFYNGDIVLDKESEAIIYGSCGKSRRRKRATMRSSRLWPRGIVPFTMAENIMPKSKKVILRAMKNIEKNTCIRFRRKKSHDKDYIRFISEPGCWSSVGRIGGEQTVCLGRGCERLGTGIHEISHALGFWHEQARPDRDKYIKILKDNISERYIADFNMANKSLVSSRGYPYDYESVMHYSKKAFTNLGENTIKVIGVGRKLGLKIGQRSGLSTIDIAQLRDMYNCNDKEDDNQTYCPDGWRKNGRSCYKFESSAREQFAGAFRMCEGLRSRLLSIDGSREDRYIRRTIRKKYPTITAWRTSGRLVNGTFVWYQGEGRTPKKMSYKKWKRDHPSSHSSMALIQEKPGGKVSWQGVWLGSARQMPEHAFAVICERRARRKCIKGKNADGRDYRGTLDHTIDGITCQKWTEQYPNQHKLLPIPYNNTGWDRNGLGDHNYCRNPSGQRRSRPWCFTTKDKYEWQYCDVTICSGSIARNTNAVPRELNPGKSSAERRPRDNKENGSSEEGQNKKNRRTNRESIDKKNNTNRKDDKNNRNSRNNTAKSDKTNRNNTNKTSTSTKGNNDSERKHDRRYNSSKSNRKDRQNKNNGKSG